MRAITGRVALLIPVFLSLFFSVSAQETSFKKKFGFKVGVNHTNMNFHRGYLPEGHKALASKPLRNVNIGVLLNLPITENISVQPEYLYASRNSYLPSQNATLNLQYLSMPVLLNIQMNNRLSLQAGPQFDLLIHATRKEEKKKINITHDTEERNLGAAAGFRYVVGSPLFIEGRYVHGINNVGIGQRADVVEFKYEIFEFAIGLKL